MKFEILMSTLIESWYDRPKKKQIKIISVVYALCIIPVVLDMTDLFQQSFFQKKYFGIHLSLFLAGLGYYRVLKNYRRFKNQ